MKYAGLTTSYTSLSPNPLRFVPFRVSPAQLVSNHQPNSSEGVSLGDANAEVYLQAGRLDLADAVLSYPPYLLILARLRSHNRVAVCMVSGACASGAAKASPNLRS